VPTAEKAVRMASTHMTSRPFCCARSHATTPARDRWRDACGPIRTRRSMTRWRTCWPGQRSQPCCRCGTPAD